jgi:hypothetical protein
MFRVENKDRNATDDDEDDKNEPLCCNFQSLEKVSKCVDFTSCFDASFQIEIQCDE